MTSLNLTRLKEAAGVFITESMFQVIELQYKDYLKDNSYTDNEFTAEQFIEEWKAEQELFGTFRETRDGNIKYYQMEGDDGVQLTTSEFLDDLDMNSYHWEGRCRSYWKIFREILDTDNINRQLLENILSSDATISHEQMYQLLGAMKRKCVEMVNNE